MRVARELEDEVWERAQSHCEYCQLSAKFYRSPFQIDHIIAKQHGGPTVSDNLALACFHCNVHKGPNIAGIDPRTGALAPLFNPRRDLWAQHFQWRGPVLVGSSPEGRATIIVLAINDPDYVAVRQALIAEGVFPPEL